MIQTTPIILNEEYSSMEDLSFGAKRWKLDFKKISSEKIRARLKMIDGGLFQLSEIKINGKILQNGIAPKNYTTIILPGDEMQSFKWQYLDIDSKSLLVMPRDDPFFAITNNSFHVFTISIHNDYIVNIAQELDLQNVSNKLNMNGQIYAISKNYLRLLNSYINVIFYDFFQTDERLNKQEELSNIVHKLCRSLLKYINDHEARIPQAKLRRIDEAALKFCEFYNCSPVPDLSIDKFCRENVISQRTLEKAINEYFWISPISLIKALKLNLFRKNLVSNYLTISDTAKGLGIKHLGQLSADYKKLFNELPSDTINRLR